MGRIKLELCGFLIDGALTLLKENWSGYQCWTDKTTYSWKWLINFLWLWIAFPPDLSSCAAETVYFSTVNFNISMFQQQHPCQKAFYSMMNTMTHPGCTKSTAPGPCNTAWTVIWLKILEIPGCTLPGLSMQIFAYIHNNNSTKFRQP